MGILNLFGNKKENDKDVVKEIRDGNVSYTEANAKYIVNFFSLFINYTAGRLTDKATVLEAAAHAERLNFMLEELEDVGCAPMEFHENQFVYFDTLHTKDAIKSSLAISAATAQSSVAFFQCIKALDEKFGGGFSIDRLIQRTYTPEILYRAITGSKKSYIDCFGKKNLTVPDETKFKAFIEMIVKLEEAMMLKKKTVNEYGMLIDKNGDIIEEDLIALYDEIVHLKRDMMMPKLKKLRNKWEHEAYADGDISLDEYKAHFVRSFIKCAHIFFDGGKKNPALKAEFISKGYSFCFSPLRKDAMGEDYTIEQFKNECLKACKESEKKIVTDYIEITEDIADDFTHAKDKFDVNGKLTLGNGRVFE